MKSKIKVTVDKTHIINIFIPLGLIHKTIYLFGSYVHVDD